MLSAGEHIASFHRVCFNFNLLCLLLIKPRRTTTSRTQLRNMVQCKLQNAPVSEKTAKSPLPNFQEATATTAATTPLYLIKQSYYCQEHCLSSPPPLPVTQTRQAMNISSGELSKIAPMPFMCMPNTTSQQHNEPSGPYKFIKRNR